MSLDFCSWTDTHLSAHAPAARDVDGPRGRAALGSLSRTPFLRRTTDVAGKTAFKDGRHVSARRRNYRVEASHTTGPGCAGNSSMSLMSRTGSVAQTGIAAALVDGQSAMSSPYPAPNRSPPPTQANDATCDRSRPWKGQPAQTQTGSMHAAHHVPNAMGPGGLFVFSSSGPGRPVKSRGTKELGTYTSRLVLRTVATYCATDLR